ncbi:OmpA family protein [Candidatus Vondammii sp. HM_W22]|uniref:OmpA family protein n=1 Tax=Candidatus Vondammii sp. HM_W22 TaxID=2687299 RepID=UPI001F129C98|nr:OmpA family protein [Candidatus Vondammii sp. HM_W22]
MKKRVVVSALAGLMLVSAAKASDNDSDYLNEVSHREWQGAGVGAIIGGSPGFVIGAAGGALFGRNSGLESSLALAQQEKISLEEALRLSRQRADRVAGELGHIQQRGSNRVDVLSESFALNIHFRTGSAGLESRYPNQLQRLAKMLQQFPELDLHVDAFADLRGTAHFNKALSEQRARVVIRHLVAQGLSRGHIIEVAHGESRTEYSAEDREGLGFDRRVLIYFCRREGV